MQPHTLEALTDGPLESREPTLDALCSTWTIDLIGHIEATGVYAETLDHNRDLAAGLLDPEQGYLTWDEKQDERTDDDAMSIARAGGERVYEQEQGYAPIILFPGLRRDGTPNADALAAAWLDSEHPSTSLTTPDMPNRRHWGDIDLGEHLDGITAWDAERQPDTEADPLARLVNAQLGREGGIPPSYAMDDIDMAELRENAPDLAEHIERMLDQQAAAMLAELEHAQAAERAHMLTTHGQPCRCRRTARTAPTYRERTRPWRDQAQARKRALTARGPVPAPKPHTIPPGRQVIPEDPAWRRAHGPRIVQALNDWYPHLRYGSPAWQDAAQRVYHALKQAA